MGKRLAVCVAVLALSFTAAPAKDIPVGGMTLEQIASWLQDAGYKAVIKTEKDGKRSISSAADGTNFHVSQYDCKDNVCGSFQLYVGFDSHGAFDAQKINAWNRKSRWVKAYVDEVNDPWVEMDVDVYPGSSYENIDDEFAVWRERLRAFRSEFANDLK